MAVTILPFYAIVLRPFRRELSKEGCRFIVDRAFRGGAYDGEIMAFGAMNSRDHEASIRYLTQLGYRRFQEAENPDDADFVCFELGEGPMPDWLECVEWRSLDDPKRGGQIWKLKNSEVYDLVEFSRPNKLPRKGFEVDWPPFIGKCWG